MAEQSESVDLHAMTTQIVVAHVANNVVSVGDLSKLIQQVFEALAKVESSAAVPEKPQPAVSIKIGRAHV